MSGDLISGYLLSVVFSKHILQTRVVPFAAILRQYISPLMKPPIQDHIVVLLPVYTPVPLLLEALLYSQAARALAKSEWPKMPVPD
jgi:hypothetical protein